jgi:P-type Cu2+ transporter
MESNADKHGMESAAKQEPHEHQDHQDHHARMAADFRNRFWISLGVTLQIPILSPLLHTWPPERFTRGACCSLPPWARC